MCAEEAEAVNAGTCYLRYRRDIPEGVKFSTIRYPLRANITMEMAEHMKAAMPDPEKFEIIDTAESD